MQLITWGERSETWFLDTELFVHCFLYILLQTGARYFTFEIKQDIFATSTKYTMMKLTGKIL